MSLYRARVQTLRGCPRALTPAWSIPTTLARAFTGDLTWLKSKEITSRIVVTIEPGRWKTILCVSTRDDKGLYFRQLELL